MSVEAAATEGAPSRLHGFDPLRAALALAVIAWHTRLLGGPPQLHRRALEHHPLNVGDWLNYQVLCLAVPAFFLVSLFLYAQRSAEHPGALRRRLEYVAALYAFWLAAVVLAQGGVAYAGQILGYDWPRMLRFVVTGGDTPFYFFFSLGILTLVVAWARRRSTSTVASLFVVSLLGLVALQATAFLVPGAAWTTAHSNPLNFLPCALLAVLLASRCRGPDRADIPSRWLLVAGASWVALGAAEWWVWTRAVGPGSTLGMPAYTRLSVVAGAALLVLVALRVRRPAPGWVRTLSDSSLGTYCTHPFLMAFLLSALAPMTGARDRVVFFVGVYLGSLVVTALLQRIFSHRLV